MGTSNPLNLVQKRLARGVKSLRSGGVVWGEYGTELGLDDPDQSTFHNLPHVPYNRTT